MTPEQQAALIRNFFTRPIDDQLEANLENLDKLLASPPGLMSPTELSLCMAAKSLCLAMGELRRELGL